MINFGNATIWAVGRKLVLLFDNQREPVRLMHEIRDYRLKQEEELKQGNGREKPKGGAQKNA